MKRFKYSIWFFVLALTLGCAAKRPTSPPPYADTPGAPNATVWPKAGDEVPFSDRTAGPESAKKNSIALVLGGAGVSSFATIGLLKRFREEGVKIEMIVATGWPVLFALGYGSLKSVHDLEWQASRLQEKDFKRVGDLDPTDDPLPVGKISDNLKRFFPAGDLSASRIPVLVSLSATDLGGGRVESKGDWKEPLLQSLAFPGLYRELAAPEESWLGHVKGLDVEEALKRHQGPVVAVNMYEDFRRYLLGRSGTSDKQSLYTQAYVVALQKGLKTQLAETPVVGQIQLGVAPTDFSAKRAAIQAGYREGKRLSRLLQ